MSNKDVYKIKTYFPDLNDGQIEQLNKLCELYVEWNAKVNLVSRKDIEFIFDHHVLHSMAIYRYTSFIEGSRILDLGTGGGLPGLPLAICFPESKFHLVDARSKKIMVVDDMIERLDLKNAHATHARVEGLKTKYDFIISRAVASVSQLLEWSKTLLSTNEKNALPNGHILLKGGDVESELKEANVFQHADIQSIHSYFPDPWFEEKKIVYVQG